MTRTVLALLVVGGALLGTVAAAGAADGDLVKVFVVQDPAQTGGQPATLGSIAATVLGNPDRSGEIFDLNKGQAQPDGAALNNPNDQLQPGWILRLPDDATGPAVQQARLTGGQGSGGSGNDLVTPPNLGNSVPPGSTTATTTTTVTFPLPAVLSVVGTFLLALVTVAIVGRRRLAVVLAAAAGVFRRLGDPGRRRRRLAARQSVARHFATDVDSVRRAYTSLNDFAATKNRPEKPVQALRVDPTGVTAWLPASDQMAAPWENLDRTRWRRPAAAANWMNDDPTPTPTARSTAAAALLVRVGTDDDSEPVFLDLSRLDGVLSVTGDHAVARDVVQNLLTEISRSRPNTPVLMLRGTDGAPPLAVPPGLNEISRIDEPKRPAADLTVRRVVRGSTARPVFQGLVVMAGTPTAREAAELAALCGPDGAGWTGLVCGEVNGSAHWRWYTDDHGRVEIPTLGLQLTVPA